LIFSKGGTPKMIEISNMTSMRLAYVESNTSHFLIVLVEICKNFPDRNVFGIGN